MGKEEKKVNYYGEFESGFIMGRDIAQSLLELLWIVVDVKFLYPGHSLHFLYTRVNVCDSGGY